MNLHFHREIDEVEIVHFAENDTIITSKFNIIKIKSGYKEIEIILPIAKLKTLIGKFRIIRRALRLDKCNVVLLRKKIIKLVIIYQGNVYAYNEKVGLKKTLVLKNCRNVLHLSIAVLPNGEIVFGEYGNNKERKKVHIYSSSDCGETWKKIYTFPRNSIKHIHGCYWDHVEKKIWVSTGDFKDECKIITFNDKLNYIETIGEGTQEWRTVSFFLKSITYIGLWTHHWRKAR